MAITERELLEKRARLWENAKDFLNTHRGENGCLSAEDDATYSRMEADIADLSKEIERTRRAENMDNMLNAPMTNPITGKPEGTGNTDLKTGRASKAYHEEFVNVLRGKIPVENVLSVGSDVNGGYLVPEEFERQLVTGLEEAGVVRALANVITTDNDTKIPVLATRSIAHWTEENGAYTESNPTFNQKTIDAYKLTDMIRVSEELMQDAFFNVEAYVLNEMVNAFAVAEEAAFCVGTGSGQPTGIFTASGGEVGVTTANAAAITADEIISIIYGLKAPYRQKASFLMNDGTVAAIRKLKDGNGQYIWQPAVQAGQPDLLFGYKLYTSPAAPTVEAGALAIAFGDFKNYWIADRGPRTLKRLNELYAGNGQIGFVASERLDAKVILPEAIKLLKMHA
jgi:HK97 family phage major capsid protein